MFNFQKHSFLTFEVGETYSDDSHCDNADSDPSHKGKVLGKRRI